MPTVEKKITTAILGNNPKKIDERKAGLLIHAVGEILGTDSVPISLFVKILSVIDVNSESKK